MAGSLPHKAFNGLKLQRRASAPLLGIPMFPMTLVGWPCKHGRQKLWGSSACPQLAYGSCHVQQQQQHRHHQQQQDQNDPNRNHHGNSNRTRNRVRSCKTATTTMTTATTPTMPTTTRTPTPLRRRQRQQKLQQITLTGRIKFFAP